MWSYSQEASLYLTSSVSVVGFLFYFKPASELSELCKLSQCINSLAATEGLSRTRPAFFFFSLSADVWVSKHRCVPLEICKKIPWE